MAVFRGILVQSRSIVVAALCVMLAASLGVVVRGDPLTLDAASSGASAGKAVGGREADRLDPRPVGSVAAGREPGRTVGTAGDGPPQRCEGANLCVGAAKGIVTPSQQHIDGVVEERLGGEKVQKFNLGGFGTDPLQNFPDPVSALGDELTAPATRTHFEGSRGREDTWLRAMVVQSPDDETVAFLVLDAVGAGNIIIERLTNAVSVATGIPPANVIFGQTHSHAGADLQGLWGGVPQDWIENVLYPQAAAVVSEAFEALVPATLDVRHGHIDEFNNFRRPKRIDPGIDTDTMASLLQARDAGSGEVVASLLQFNAHPTSINENVRAPHPDYILGAVDWLEENSGGTALYFNGPIADASPSGERPGCDYPDDGRYGDVRCRGEGMAQAALGFELDRVLEPSLSVRHETVYLPVTNPLFVAVGLLGSFNRYYDFLQLPADQIPLIGELVAAGLTDLPQIVPTASTLTSRVTIGGEDGGLELVTLPGEATGTFGEWVRGLAAPDAHVMLLGLTQNSFGYIIPEEEFSYLDASGKSGFLAPFTGYEEFVSLGPLTAPLLRAQGYIPLFDGDPTTQLPSYLRACATDPSGEDCLLHTLARHLDYVQEQLEQNCLGLGGPEDFCSLLNPRTPLARMCENAALPPGVCDLLRRDVRSGSGVGDGQVKAGVGVVDMTPDVGYCSGQYCDVTDQPDALAGGEIDPYLTHKSKQRSYGVQSRLTARALAVEGANGKRVVLLKTDNYLPQDMLIRRVAQILGRGDSGITHDQILHHASHNHTSSYSATWAWGVALFQDLFDPRFFEHQARKIAQAIELAVADLRPARMGATTVRHNIFKGNVVGMATADDGSPAGFPKEYGDHGLVVMRFDDISDPGSPRPLAVWANWGQHPEGLDGYDLHSGDFLAPLERFVDREIGAPLLFSQGDVGSAERSGNRCHVLGPDGELLRDAAISFGSNGRADCGPIAPDEGVIRDWDHRGYVQTERGARYLADDVVRGFHEIATIASDDPVAGKVAFRSDFPVDHRSVWVPGPLSHPYPGVSNCLTAPTIEGDVGVPILGLPDCERLGIPGENPLNDQLAMALATAKAEGLPVPDHYNVTAFSGVEENLRLHLQVVRLGEVLLASCACEAQADLVLNFETRANRIEGDQFNGFDWACVAEDKGLLPRDDRYAAACDVQRAIFDVDEFPTEVPGSLDDPDALARMRAQVHNDALGWEAPDNVLAAGSEPEDADRIWGNFTHREIQFHGVAGYTLPVGVGMAGDYNGYTVSYREYMNRDHYRKALTSHGPHTADYMVTRLVGMAAGLKGAPGGLPEPLAAVGMADEIRQEMMTLAVASVTKNAYEVWLAALPADAGPAAATGQPSDLTRFDATHFSWRGGNTQVDNPRVRVERLVEGAWTFFADGSGEVPVQVQWPEGLPGLAATYTGSQEWIWTAGFEAYGAFPERLGSTPLGTYRFVAGGCINDGLADLADLDGKVLGLAEALLGHPLRHLRRDVCPANSRSYEVVSDPFEVGVWPVGVTDVRWDAGTVAFQVPPIEYPRSYESEFGFIRESEGPICKECTFRPWAQRGTLATAEVHVAGAVRTASCDGDPAGGWSCSAAGVPPGGGFVVVSDSFGNEGRVPLPGLL